MRGMTCYILDVELMVLFLDIFSMTLTCERQPCIGTGLILLPEPYTIKKHTER